jgi:hypothetical protein
MPFGDNSGSTYPGTVDTSTDESNDPGGTVVDAFKINDMADAILAIETELGINPAGSLTNVVTFLQTEHNADGTHSAISADSVTTTGNINTSGGSIQEAGLSIRPPVGFVGTYVGTTAPSGWILADGGTIGDAGSGATNRANADTETLYALFWDNMADAQAPVSTGRGASAAADFAAGKTITISDLRGKTAFGTGGTAPATHGDNGGAETHTLTESEMPAHTHAQKKFNTAFSGPSDTNGNSSGSTNMGLNTGSTGGGGAHNNMPPWVALSYIIKL